MKNKLIAAISIFFLLSCTGDNSNDAKTQNQVPDFRLEGIKHQRFYLNRHQGKIIVIVFWATWCKVCKKYLNELEKIKPEWNEKQIALLSIVVDPENRDSLNELLKTSIHVSYPVLLDRKRQVMEKFNIKKIPTTIVIGQTNSIVMQKEGYNLSTISQIRYKLNLLLENEK